MSVALRNFAALKIFMQLFKKHIITLGVALLTLNACGKKEKELTPQQVRAKADSIVQSKMDKLKRQAKEDLDKRLPIELKPKIDSILKVSREPQPVPVFPEDNIGLDDTGTPIPPVDTVKK
jgi:predicted small lipoprotein YifL